MSQIKKLSFTFHYEDPILPMPTGIGFHPDIRKLPDEVLLFLGSVIIRTLSQRHGLEQALKMMEDSGYGRIGDSTKFVMKYHDRKEMEEVYGDLPECCEDEEDNNMV